MAIENESKTGGKLTKLRQMLEEAKHDVEELGGIPAFKTGEWVFAL